MRTTEGWLDRLAGPHTGQPILTAGASLGEASAALIMLHGRGATAEGILDLADVMPAPGVAYLAPQAAGNTWYPYSFLEPRALNEPHLSSAYAVIERIISRLSDLDIPADRIALLGFSQGACLATDSAAMFSMVRGGVIGLSGGLIGDRIALSGYRGNLEGVPAFLGCSDIDPHIPVERVHESSQILKQLGASVTTTIYPGMGHTINLEEIKHAQRIVKRIAGA